ncbi:unnamed protein product [Eruca vesicaria subsp. sativa]|uniref:Uncharacterized protein n=1 Tax=Eruca vesicaria subsp. sativa TaxID=29727 RepID=A0ABC8J8K8_ERUVS|nr:unnamed protein product [Eruca vesicaria subsp. sativa]
MKKQVTIVPVLLILMALCSNLDMVVEAQLGPGDCYDGCSTGCVQRDCEHFLQERRPDSIASAPFGAAQS